MQWAASRYYLATHRVNCPIRWFDILILFPYSRRAPCFFVTPNLARTAAIAIVGCASKRNRFLFIFQIGLHAWLRRACTICITSPLITKRIGRAQPKLPRGKLRAAARVIMQRGFLTLAHSGPGSRCTEESFSRVPARTPHKDKLIQEWLR